MKEIKVGEYVRTNVGEIGKVIEVTKNYCRKDDGFKIWFAPWRELKHSKNIIDLIECGDYVNGYRIDNIINGVLVNRAVGLDRSGVLTPIVQYEQDIKTILTHEQFEQNSYKV